MIILTVANHSARPLAHRFQYAPLPSANRLNWDNTALPFPFFWEPGLDRDVPSLRLTSTLINEPTTR